MSFMNEIPDDKTLEAVFRKIPELRHGRVIGLHSLYFKRLTDLEFIIFYKMPGITVRVAPKTMQYIEERRLRLNLPKSPTKIE